VKYAFIESHRAQFCLSALCRVLRVSRSGYYEQRARPSSVRSQVDDALTQQIEQIHRQYRACLGALKTWQVLRQRGIAVGKHRVARLRRAAGIEARRKQRFRVMVEHHYKEPPAPDRVRRGFQVAAPNQVWVGDMTVVRTREGWLYLAIVLDLYARRVVGWAMDANQSVALPIAALTMAIAQRQPAPGLVCHTDQGVQYSAARYREVLQTHGIQASMSRKGNCHDNAVAESFFSNLKNELTHHAIYDTRRQAKAAIFDYIELLYNRLRPHQTLGYQTPVAVEEQFYCA
jgi:transposase InsO family protein